MQGEIRGEDSVLQQVDNVDVLLGREVGKDVVTLPITPKSSN